MKRVEASAVVESFGPLAFLSLQRTERGRTPMAPSNEERLRAFRSVQPAMPANNYEWAFRQSGADHKLSVEPLWMPALG